ncbi:MAG: hypothetical protein ACYDAL_17045 [Candidatus Dormibacteraceae bacterium]
MSDRRIALIVLVSVCLLALALGVGLAWHSHQFSSASPVVSTPTATVTVHGECHSVNGLPDSTCTPGVADPRVTQDNILTTICVSGYTTRVRPSSQYTDALKVQQIQAYGYADTKLADYEEDHLIPLELGGHPTDPKNLWPEPLTGPYPATKKDGLENSLHTKVCARLLTLVAAQTAIAKNWEAP